MRKWPLLVLMHIKKNKNKKCLLLRISAIKFYAGVGLSQATILVNTKQAQILSFPPPHPSSLSLSLSFSFSLSGCWPIF
jgi:hypothetical protein